MFLYLNKYGKVIMYSQRIPTLPRKHALSCIYKQLIGEFQVFFIYLFYSVLQNK